LEPESKEDRDEIRKLNNKYLPYTPSLCQSTFLELQKHATLDDKIPESLIEAVLKDEEQRIIDKLKIGHFNYSKIYESWGDCKKSNYRNTIRDIQSVEITLINDEQCFEVAKYPYKFQSLSMYKFSLIGWLNKISKSDLYDSDDWMVKKLEENTFIGETDNDEDIKYELKSVSDYKSIPAQVYVNAKYFGYENTFGFNWQYSETFNQTSPKRDWAQKKDDFKPLQKDTFYEHNKALIGAFETEFLGKNHSKLDFEFKELAKFINRDDLQKKDFIKLIKLMIILHDYGKLNEKWQKPIQTYQALKEGKDPKDFKEILGHTDYDMQNNIDLEFGRKAKLGTRPAHAGIGAFVAQEILPDLFDSEFITSCIPKAIARHHSPLSLSFPDFSISSTNYLAIKRLLLEFDLNIELEKEDFADMINGFEFDDWENEQIVYLFFVRILRLCDQKATEDFKQYFNVKNHV